MNRHVETTQRDDGTTELRVYEYGRLVEKRIIPAVGAAPCGRLLELALESL